ncbi:MAG TPA: citramalate synthase [bacterium]|nr:citramalate synthase [Dictyoglomota bacterium]HHV80834.1 citramalate synthase [bacterium]HOL55677.1 citramalate synthase [bacterium]HOP56343.1 citramalate synthase [bacterium]
MIYVYDTTLRDGAQREGISFSVEDKLKITTRLDELGVHYIEGGWPGSNPKDAAYFNKAKDLKLKNARIVAFGSTRRTDKVVSEDANIRALLEADTPSIAIFGKSWGLHVTEVLHTTLEENLKLISDSVGYVKSKGKEVIFDAEHFFDGFKENPQYAIATLKVAQEQGADWIVLCDTNGGNLPNFIADCIEEVKKYITAPLGIHAHNDSDLAVANTIVAVQKGATQIQGTINGYGERCGNANLCSCIPIIQLKLNLKCLSDESLKKLFEVSHYVDDIANNPPVDWQPFVGSYAFAHKGGIHVNAILKNPLTYEHINPELVGNRRRILVSELSGKSNILYKIQELGLDIDLSSLNVSNLLEKIKQLEYQGYEFEGAEASFELLVKEMLGIYKPPFEVKGFRVFIDKIDDKVTCEGTVKINVDGTLEHTASEGNGPVDALDTALRKALTKFFPKISAIKLTDYKVRVLEGSQGTSATVRVLIESTNGKSTWSTVGVSPNILEASYQALVDSLAYGLSFAND